jgi:N6-adenosine-specific RNA methylase IME4
MDKREWMERGMELARRQKHDAWALGVWYIEGQQAFGRTWCRQLTDGPDWHGVGYSSLRVYAWVCRRIPETVRYLNDVEFSLYQEAARLKTLDARMALIADAERHGWKTNRVRIEARLRSRTTAYNGTDIVTDVETLIGRGSRFRVIYCDPPWDWTRRPGKRGSSDGRYPLLIMEQLRAIRVWQIATADALLFMRCSAANLKTHGFPLLEAWSFDYVTHGCWDKQELGTGSYFRMEHEDLVLGRKPSSPTHFDDSTISSMIRQRRSRRHSEKPALHDLIQRAAQGPYVELFGRTSVKGWTVCGNEIELPGDDTQLAAD